MRRVKNIRKPLVVLKIYRAYVKISHKGQQNFKFK